MQNAYTLDTSDIVIPLTELLGQCYVITDPHPLSQFEVIANLALESFNGQSKEIPIFHVLERIKIYQGRPPFNDIADLMVKLWARYYYFMSSVVEDISGTMVNVISISGGDIRIVFEELGGDMPDDKPNIL